MKTLSEILADPKFQESLQASATELMFSDGTKHQLQGRLVGTGLFTTKSPEAAINRPTGEVSFRTVMTLTPEGLIQLSTGYMRLHKVKMRCLSR